MVERGLVVQNDVCTSILIAPGLYHSRLSANGCHRIYSVLDSLSLCRTRQMLQSQHAAQSDTHLSHNRCTHRVW